MPRPCRFIEHGSQADQLEEAGLSANHITATVRSLLQRPKVLPSTPAQSPSNLQLPYSHAFLFSWHI